MNGLSNLSERTSAAFMTYFPNCKRKQALAKFIMCLAKAVKVATSRTKYDKKDWLHSAYGWIFTEDQNKVLEELKFYMMKTKFGANFFSGGILLYIESLYGLRDYMKTTFDLPYLLTSHVENDHHERFIGVIRQFDGKGGNRRPTALQLTYRISR